MVVKDAMDRKSVLCDHLIQLKRESLLNDILYWAIDSAVKVSDDAIKRVLENSKVLDFLRNPDHKKWSVDWDKGSLLHLLAVHGHVEAMRYLLRQEGLNVSDMLDVAVMMIG